jgi:hypothetical protein
MGEVFQMAKEEKKQKPFKDESIKQLDGIVKIEKKKGFKKKSKEPENDVKKLLERP